MDFQPPDDEPEEEEPPVLDDEELRNVFNEWDTDHSGKIKCSEIADVLKALKYEPEVAQKAAETIIKANDLDKDGKLTFAEFKAAIAKQDPSEV